MHKLMAQRNMKNKSNNHQNDIVQYETKKKSNLINNNHEQSSFADVKFFSDCANQLSSVAKQAKLQQQKLQYQKRIKKLQQTNALNVKQKQSAKNEQSMLIYNIIIDYFRSYQINYSYSVFMRQKDILHQDLVLKKDLAKVLQLEKQFDSDHRLNVPIFQIILQKLKHFQSMNQQKKQKHSQNGVQVELLQSSGTNNTLLWDIKLDQMKKQIEKRQRKYYQAMAHSFKEQQLLKVKEEMTKLYEQKQKKIAQKYQIKMKEMIQNNKNEINYKKFLQKNEEYLKKIQNLNQQLMKERQKTKSLSFKLESHNCFDNESIKEKEQLLRNQRKQMIKRKEQFQLALRNMDTKIEDLITQKQKIMDKNRKSTDQFLMKVKVNKQNKDYMIDQIYGRIHVLQKRVQILSNDNNVLRQANHQLRNKATKLEEINKEILNKSQNQKKISIFDIKAQTKNFSINCSGEDIDNETKINFDKQSISQNESQITISSEQFEENLRKKNEYLQRVRKLEGEMKLLKNNVRYLVSDFS